MKGILTTVLVLCALAASAQFNYPTAGPMWFYLARISAPSFDTTTYSAAQYPGILQYRQQPGDTGYYFSNGARFVKVGSGAVDLSGYYTKTESDARYPLLSGTYSNPSWITGLAWSKITGAPAMVNTLNGLSGTLSLATGTSGTDFNISPSGSNITLNIPSASATARGLVTTGFQTFAGSKVFSNNISLQSVPAMGSAASRYLVLNGDVVNTRMPAQVLSDIGAIQNTTTQQPSSNFNISGNGTVGGELYVKSGLGTNNAVHNGIKFGTDNDSYFSAIRAYRGNNSQSVGMSFFSSNSATPAEKMRLTSNGWLSVGSEITSSTGTAAPFVVSYDGAQFDVSPTLTSNVVTFNSRNSSTGAVIPTTFNADAIRFNTGSRGVGINKDAGTDFALDVQGNGRFSAGISAVYFNSGNPTSVVSFIGGSVLEYRGAQLDLYAGNSATNTGVMLFRTGTGSGSSPQPERMRIDASGNVGIGKINPSVMLDVAGAGNFGSLQVGSAPASITASGNASFTGLSLSARTITASTTAAVTDYTIISQATTGNPTITLTGAAGTIYVLVEEAANPTANGMVWSPGIRYKGTTYTNANNAALSAYSRFMVQNVGGTWYLISAD